MTFTVFFFINAGQKYSQDKKKDSYLNTGKFQNMSNCFIKLLFHRPVENSEGSFEIETSYSTLLTVYLFDF